jgi:hypothetical protein
LGDTEEYLATGPSIKKAQHAAAAMALEKTKLKHPLPKPKPCTKQGKNHQLHHTVGIRGQYFLNIFVKS